MSDASLCPKCGETLPANAPGGICPKCLMRAAMEESDNIEGDSPYAVTTPQGSGFIPPEPSVLAPYFPQLEILNCLGHGGMGAVYKARQKKLDRLVALKIIRPEAAEDSAFALRFNREARTLARLSHPNIVAVHDFGEVDYQETAEGTSRTLYFFLMEYVDGLNLRQVMQQGELFEEQTIELIPQVCEALQFAHDAGVVHRDIKPENILIDQRGRVKIADFGLAKLASRSDQDLSLTGTHQVMGTPRYMAPEQMAGSKTVDQRADIYSLGVVFYEMLTGQIPAGHFAPPSERAEVDERLDDVVMRALALEPESRFQQAQELKDEVEAIRRAADDEDLTPTSQPLPADPIGGVSTIFAQQLSGAWRWVKGEPVATPRRSRGSVGSQSPQFPGTLLMSLSLLGVLLTFLPWFTVQMFEAEPGPGWEGDSWITRPVNIGFRSASLHAATTLPLSQIDGRDAFVLTTTGIDVPAGITTSVIFGLLTLALLLTPTTRPLSRSKAGLLMLLSAGAIIAVCLFKENLRHESFSSSQFRNILVLGALDHKLVPHTVYYVELILASLLLTAGAVGLRNAVLQAALPQPRRGLKQLTVHEPPVPRFSLMAITGGMLLLTTLLIALGWSIGMLELLDRPTNSSSAIKPFLILAMIVLVGGSLTTTCGFVAVSQIRKSSSRLTGLPLACINLLALPLMVIDLLIFAVMFSLMVGLNGKPNETGGVLIEPQFVAQAAVLTLFFGGLLDSLIVYLTWRKLSPAGPESAVAMRVTREPVSPRFSKLAIGGGCVLALTVMVAGAVAIVMQTAHWRDEVSPLVTYGSPGIVLIAGGVLASVLGFVARSQIRGSGGRLTGLGLAGVNILSGPLLLIDVLVFIVAMLLSMNPRPDGTMGLSSGGLTQSIIFTLLIGVVTNAVIIGWTWRRFFGHVEEFHNEETKNPSFTGSPLANLQFTVAASKSVISQAVFHFSSLGYTLVARSDESCLFDRGAYFGGLYETDIRKLRTRLTVRTALLDELSQSDTLPQGTEMVMRRVSCQWTVKTWGAWIMGFDVRTLEGEGESFKAMLGGSDSRLTPTETPRHLTGENESELTANSATRLMRTDDESSSSLTVGQSTLDAPAMGLMVIGTMMALAHGLTILNTTGIENRMGFVPGIVTGLLGLAAGIQMKFAKTLSGAKIGCYAMALPASPLWILSLPVGVWSLVMLNRKLNEASRKSPPEESDKKTATVEQRAVSEAESESDVEMTPEELVSSIQVPSIAAVIMGTLMVVFHTICLVDGLQNPTVTDWAWFWLPGIIGGVLQLIAGLNLYFLRSSSWVEIGCYASYLPLSPGWLFSMYVGVWGLEVLDNPAVTELFAQRREGRRQKLAPLPIHIRQQIDGPSLLLIIAGTCTFLGNLGAVILNQATGADPDKLFYMVGGIMTGIGMTIGGVKMRSAQSLGWAQVGAAAAVLPVSVGWPLTLIVGIWCFNKLNSPAVLQAFAEREPPA